MESNSYTNQPIFVNQPIKRIYKFSLRMDWFVNSAAYLLHVTMTEATEQLEKLKKAWVFETEKDYNQQQEPHPLFFPKKNFQDFFCNGSLVWRFLSKNKVAFYDVTTNSAKIIKFDDSVKYEMIGKIYYASEVETINHYSYFPSEKQDEFFMYWRHSFGDIPRPVSIYHMKMEPSKGDNSLIDDPIISNCSSISYFTAKTILETTQKFTVITSLLEYQGNLHVATKEVIFVLDYKNDKIVSQDYGHQFNTVSLSQNLAVVAPEGVRNLETEKFFAHKDYSIDTMSANGEFLVCNNKEEKIIKIYQILDHTVYSHKIDEFYCSFVVSKLHTKFMESYDFSEDSDYMFILERQSNGEYAFTRRLLIYSLRQKKFVSSQKFDGTWGGFKIKIVENFILFYSQGMQFDELSLNEVWELRFPIKMKPKSFGDLKFKFE